MKLNSTSCSNSDHSRSQSGIDFEEYDSIIDANNALVLPGMIDAHIHVGKSISKCYLYFYNS